MNKQNNNTQHNNPVLSESEKMMIKHTLSTNDLKSFKMFVPCLIERQITPEQIKEYLFELDGVTSANVGQAKVQIIEVFLHSLRRNYGLNDSIQWTKAEK